MEYTVQREIDKKGTLIVDRDLTKHHWAMFTPNLDIRIDYDIEPRDENRDPKGVRTAVQQKAADGVKSSSKRGVTCKDLEVEHVLYWVDRCTRPVFLFCVDITAKRWWWLFIQEYILETYPKTLGKDWRKQTTMNVYIPPNQSCDDFAALEKALWDSYRFMAKRYPLSFVDHLSGIQSHLASFGSDVNFAVECNSGQTRYKIAPASGSQKFGLIVKASNPERIRQLADDIIGRAVETTINPGEIHLVGSSTFETDEFRQFFKEMTKIHLPTRWQQDVHVVIPQDDGSQKDLTFHGVTFEGGTLEIRMNGSILNGLVSFSGVSHPEENTNHLSVGFHLGHWISLPFSDPPYFEGILAYVRSALKMREMGFYIQRHDKRIFLGNLPPLKKRSIGQWQELMAVIKHIGDVKTICERLHVDVRIPEVFTHDANEMAQNIIRVTDYSTKPTPFVNVSAGLGGISPEGMKALEQEPTQLPATLTLHKEEMQCSLYGVTLTVPAHAYTFTKMLAKSVQITDHQSAIVEFNGTDHSTTTIRPLPNPQ